MRDNILAFPQRTRDERTRPHPDDTPRLRAMKELAAQIKAQARAESREDFEAQRRLADAHWDRD